VSQLPSQPASVAEREISASFEQESGATRDGKVVPNEAGAYIHPSRHAMICAEEPRARDVAWRRVPGPFWGTDEAGEAAVVGWATAESSATGCGADHDRMTSVPSRSSLVSR